MTPAQAVAWDAMRSAYDEATVKRMERAVDGRVESMSRAALAASAFEFGRDMDIDEPRVFRVVDAALKLLGHGGVWAARGTPSLNDILTPEVDPLSYPLDHVPEAGHCGVRLVMSEPPDYCRRARHHEGPCAPF